MNLKPHYHENKEYYIERELNYNKFLTVIRHLSKLYDFVYKKNIKYNNSSYDIEYHILIPRLSTEN